MDNLKIQKDFFCVNCNYSTYYKRDYNNHLLTNKHKNRHCASDCNDADVPRSL